MLTVDHHLALTGIGYEGLDIAAFVDQLERDEVSTVVDVRLTPISRKPGFSKRRLSDTLTAAGIEYLHAPALGNPKWNRAGFGGTDHERHAAREAFAAMLTSSDAEAWLTDIARLAAERHVALLCFEADQQRCHRDVVCEGVQARAAALHDRLA
ncbi:DUF488 domain-containing protein [Actinoallomurus sp. NBC_01490]|uniref:DUF488 domain-containing protein n=1 Tax=Actinoallomurus sp. NBC_01490 TaxID=2903557 RepID=UPI002E312461|nr:DUF488 domain-containing protein [Actinoallomurus sp. NBC_01490]